MANISNQLARILDSVPLRQCKGGFYDQAFSGIDVVITKTTAEFKVVHIFKNKLTTRISSINSLG